MLQAACFQGRENFWNKQSGVRIFLFWEPIARVGMLTAMKWINRRFFFSMEKLQRGHSAVSLKKIDESWKAKSIDGYQDEKKASHDGHHWIIFAEAHSLKML